MVTQWYCQILGDEFPAHERGPVTADELRSMAASGALAVDDLVRAGVDSEWVVAGTVPGLFAALSSASSSGSSLSGEFLATTDGNPSGDELCSLELRSSDTRASIRWSTTGKATVANRSADGAHAPVVKVPLRTLKIGHGATPAGRAEKRAHQTTVANHFNPEADTVISADVAAAENTAEASAEHRL